ncbi:hypothetical protein PPERSA_07753 [Pseudocohnilembus persalinus]|uniref:Tetratricopeptide repeat protein n=1 Tax=Pseudocohnilembus persalinus TaxID=266149 RepID=A0A0V0R9S4_PSEPJ|nr:hypothetical protein PPERSA_07753 [Pseudocohnilembus persalinus]|eukprot:KRX11228.1 hypothetical protein PPERSA_07753 [Pseudocohnilembus persalinus]
MINSINEGPTYNLGMGGHSNSRKPQTPQQTEVNRRLQQTAKNQGNSTKGKKMFSSINKSIDNNYQNHQGSPRKSSKSVYTTLNNQQMLQQSANNNINNAQVLKKYLNSQNANNMLVMQQQKQQQSQNLVNNANSYNYPGGKIKYQRRNKISNNSYSLHSNNNIMPNSRKHINLNDENSINYEELFYKKQGMLNASSSQKNSSISMIQMSGNYNDSLIHSNSTFANPQIQDQYMKKKKEKDQKSQQAKKFLQQGKQYFKQNQLQNAIECFQQAISIDSDNLDSRYLMGVCFLQSLDYNKSISEFNQLLERNKAYKQNVYLLLSIAYKKKNDVNQAINMLGQAIKYFPKYYDAYIYRGKLLVKMKKYEQAVSDFEEAINLDQTKALGYIGKADCLRLLERYKDAIEFYGIAMQIDQAVRKVALLKRGITYSENNNIEESLQDFQSILDDDPCNSEACYFKGLQYLKLDNKNEANLAFEQAIKHNNSKNAVSKSLYEIAKIKIELRDFYQAFYTLQRSEFLDVDQELLKPFRMFTDSVTYLMKRKFQEGVDLLNQLILSLNFSKKSNNQSNTKQNNMNSSTDNIVSARKQGSNTELLKQLVFSYRSYGLFCLGQHQKALNDLLLTEQQNKVLEEPNQYNKVICQGIVSVSEFKYEEAFELFKKAGQLQPKKMEPYFYKAMALCHQSKHKIDANDTLKKERYASNALMCMEKAESLNNQNAVFYYCRAVLLFSQNKLDSEKKQNEQQEQKEKQIRLIQVFPTHNRLCSIFPEVQLPLKKVKVALRLSYCLPCVPIPNIEPKFEQNLLDILQPTTIENKPEAPWIKKNAQGVIFTDNMLELQDDIEITDTQRENDNSQDEEDDDEDDDDDENRQSDQQGREYEQHELEQLINRDDSFYEERQYNNKEDQRQSIRNQLLLDNGIEEKLNKLLKKKEEQKKQKEQQQQ